jgi:cytochrome c biogenesis protein
MQQSALKLAAAPRVARAGAQLLSHLGALPVAFAWLVLLLAGAAAGLVHEPARGWTLAVPLALLAVSLAAALVAQPRFRRQTALLVFHLALLALLVLVVVGRLTGLQGRFELTQGFAFDGQLLDHEAGALHPWHLRELAFTHDGFSIDYAPGLKRGPTRNPVRWRDAQGALQSAVIGDHRPLLIDGYRFYTSPNKGFAPVLAFYPAQGEAVRGSIHLPSYPAHALRQARAWTLPDGTAAWTLLAIDETLIDPNAAARFRLPSTHRLVLEVAGVRHELSPGDRLPLAGGTLIYEGLRTWMGYRVFYDPTLPWLLAAALLAALSLGWHLVAGWRRRPWREVAA